MKRFVLFLAVGLASIGAAGPAFAESGIGFRGGLSLDPDDFVVGIHFRTDPISENNLFIVPSIEAGFGDVTMLALNGDLHYVFDVDAGVDPYIGGGVTINWFDYDDGGGSDTEVGGGVLGGILFGSSRQMFFEVKLGLGDVPDAKLLVGWNLH
ncbi:MAG TPA: hypothetical protein VFP10_06480 [Candidatus Eisenbacteria bacterium]|nr:hypothetical protein [Candidatus Eisenbacteria bacterium]